MHRNYGSLLQNYSLLHTLAELGHEPYYIARYIWNKPKWTIPAPPYKNKKEAVLDFFKHPFKYFKTRRDYQWKLYNEYLRPWNMQMFYKKYIWATDDLYNRQDFLANPPEADCYICGSDQVWWPDDKPEVFLDFAPKGRRIAYSASRAWADTTEKWYEVARKELPYFAGVSVREEEGVPVTAKAGRNDTVVAIDPVLLHDGDWYVNRFKLASGNHSKPYILLYVLNVEHLESIPFKELEEYCRKNSLRLKAVAAQGAERVIPQKYLTKANPAEFLQLVYNAQAVVTNSFHGCVFSLVFNRPFAAILQTGSTTSQNTRFMTLLSRCHETQRIVNSANAMNMFEKLLRQKPDQAISFIEKWRAESLTFLRDSLEKIK